MSLKKRGTFENDLDFVTLGNSPSRFHSSEEETEDDSLKKVKQDDYFESHNDKKISLGLLSNL